MPNVRRTKAQSAGTTPALPNPDAAGIDIGATEIYVAVPPDRAPQPVRSFATFTADLLTLADWLAHCHIRTVAMESTGVYWIPLYQILEARGFVVFLVNARHVKNVPGRKTDVADCQWLQYLHTVGLLRASFRPVQAVCAVRSLLRHRDSLVKLAARHIQHMQKALNQMNLQLHHVISDLSGVTGLAIVDAILAGERDGHKLAALKDRRIQASAQTIAKSLVGDYRSEHLFTLRQALASYRHYQQLITDCDAEIDRLLAAFDAKTEGPVPDARRGKRKPQRNEPKFDWRPQLYRISGVDLTQVPGLSTLTVQVLFAEIGSDLSAFPTVKHFVSWLGLCPDNRISGGRVLSARTRLVKNRAAHALRIAAQTLLRSRSYLGDYFRRMRAKLGAPKAITAVAHKLARIIYQLLTTGQGYDETVFAENEERYRRKSEQRLKTQARALGFDLVPLQTAAGVVS